MTDFNFDNYYEGDSEDRDHILWNEFDWQKYLQTNQKEIQHFTTLYHQHRIQKGRSIDDIAREMGWIVESSNQQESSSPEAVFFEVGADISELNQEATSYDYVYTLHKHPLNIICQGMHNYVQYQWERFVVKPENHCSPVLPLQFASATAKIQQNMLFGVYAIETTDFAMAISHFKLALSAVNASLNTLNPLRKKDSENLKYVKFGLFDMREILLKTMQDCRDAENPSMPGEFE